MNNCIYGCYGFTVRLVWAALQYLYLMLLQVVAFVLALITRKVQIKVLNDSKEMFIIVYTSTTIMVGLGIITFALGSRLILNEALFCGGILLATTVFLVFIFVPKVSIQTSKSVNAIILDGMNNCIYLSKRSQRCLSSDCFCLLQMIDLYQDPRGEGVFGRSGNTNSTATGKSKPGTTNTLTNSASYTISSTYTTSIAKNDLVELDGHTL